VTATGSSCGRNGNLTARSRRPPEYLAATIADAVGGNVAHDELPDWIDPLGQWVLRDVDAA
jgi:hypothetical protein